jgi:hypothetical protein
MKCTGKEWDTCRVEKMGCRGCYKEDITVGDVLMGVAATIKMVIEETGKDEETIWEVVKEMLDETHEREVQR